ncbi:MAG TPA: hypothetical protein VNO30_02905 [Kofleriaceae bacterium]|nr:hypothetical protein [Kofleriaceae bacterium]
MRTAGLFALLAPAACARVPAERVCPPLEPGHLVVTEVRGPQTPEDPLGAWIELFNASGVAVDLAGIKVRFRRKDGSSEISVLVRRSLPAAPASYTVLGLFDDDELPSHVDYGFAGDHAGEWLGAAAVDVEACGTRLDRAVYDSLPVRGTFSLGGVPDANRNDLPASWCTDGRQVGATFPGTPKSPNVACP